MQTRINAELYNLEYYYEEEDDDDDDSLVALFSDSFIRPTIL